MKKSHYYSIFFFTLFIIATSHAGYARTVATYNSHKLEYRLEALPEFNVEDRESHSIFENFLNSLIRYNVESDWEKRWNEGLRLTNLDQYKNSFGAYTEKNKEEITKDILAKRKIVEAYEKAKAADSSMTTKTFWLSLSDTQKNETDLQEIEYFDNLLNLFPNVEAADKAIDRFPADTAGYFAKHEKTLNYPLFVDLWTTEQLEAIDPKLTDLLTTDSIVKRIMESPQPLGQKIETEAEALKHVESSRKGLLKDARIRLIIHRELPKVKFTDPEFKAGLDKYVEWYLQRKTFLPPDAFKDVKPKAD